MTKLSKLNQKQLSNLAKKLEKRGEANENAKKIIALGLCEQLNKEELEDIFPTDWNENTFEFGKKEFLVCTDSEADKESKEYIKEYLWAFNASFICEHCNLPDEMAEVLQAYQEKKCEGANNLIENLINKLGDIDDFCNEAISADGRGHFLSGYDGNESKVSVFGETYFIYRTN